MAINIYSGAKKKKKENAPTGQTPLSAVIEAAQSRTASSAPVAFSGGRAAASSREAEIRNIAEQARSRNEERRSIRNAGAPAIDFLAGAQSSRPTPEQIGTAAASGKIGGGLRDEELPGLLERLALEGKAALAGTGANYASMAATNRAAGLGHSEDMVGSALENYLSAQERERRVVDAYESGAGNITEAEYEDAITQIENLQFYIDAYSKAAEAEASAPEKLHQMSKELSEASSEALEKAKYGRGTVGQFLADTAVAGMQMVADTAASGGVSAMPSMMARVFGGKAQEGYEKGYTVQQQVATGAAAATISFLTERLGENPLMGENGSVISNIINQYLDPSSPIVSSLVNLPANALGEGLEEVAENIFTELSDRLLVGDPIEIDPAELGREGLIGAALGAAGQTANLPVAAINTGAQDGQLAAGSIPTAQELAASTINQMRESRASAAETQIPAAESEISAHRSEVPAAESEISAEEIRVPAEGAEIDQADIYGQSVGAATPLRGEQVPSRNNLVDDLNLSEEARQQIYESTPTHERITEDLANRRAGRYFYTDADGRTIHLDETINELREAAAKLNEIGPEAVKAAERAVTKLQHEAVKTGDWSKVRQFNEEVVQILKSRPGQLMQAWAEYTRGSSYLVAQAADVLADVNPDPETETNKRASEKEAERTRKAVEEQVEEAVDATIEKATRRRKRQSKKSDEAPELTPEVMDQRTRDAARNVLHETWRNKQETYDALVAGFIDAGMDTAGAEALANQISNTFYGELAERSSSYLERMYGKKAGAKNKKGYLEKVFERINAGALTDDTFREIASEKLFGTAATDEVLSSISQHSEDIQVAYEDGDAEWLRTIIKDVSTERGYKPGKRIENALSKISDIDTLREYATYSTFGLAIDQRVASAGQVTSSLQTLSHLLNAKTLARNIVSNMVFAPVDTFAHNVGIIPDLVLAFITRGEGTVQQARTVGFEFLGDRAARQEYIAAANVRNALDIRTTENEGKYWRGGRTFDRNGNIFERALNRAEGALGYGLNVTDAWQKGATKARSERATAPLVASGGRVTENVANRITENEMLYRSFQRQTLLGDSLQAVKKFLNIAGFGNANNATTFGGRTSHDFGLGDFISKYTTAPGALVHTFADYTPWGVFNTVKDLFAMRKFGLGNQLVEAETTDPRYRGMTNAEAKALAQHEVAVSIGRQLTGAGLMAVGGALIKAGLVGLMDYSQEEREKYAAYSSIGKIGLPLNIDATWRSFTGGDGQWMDGDHLVDLSQLEPLDNLLKIYAIADGESDDKFVEIMSACAEAVLDQFNELPMMTTVKTVVNDIRYRGDDTVFETAGNIAIDLLGGSITGFIPGPVRQLAQALDDVKRDTSADTEIERLLNQIKSSIPGLRQTLPEKIDYRGEAQTAGDPLTRAVNAFVNPATISIYQQDDVLDYFDALPEPSDGGTLYSASYAPNSITSGGVQYELSADQKREYLATYRQNYYDYAEGFMNSGYTSSLSEQAQADAMKDIKEFAEQEAKRQAVESQGGEFDGTGFGYLYNDNGEMITDDPASVIALKNSFDKMKDSGYSDTADFERMYSWYRTLNSNAGFLSRQKSLEQIAIANEISGFEVLSSCMDSGVKAREYGNVMSALESVNEGRVAQWAIVSACENAGLSEQKARSVYAAFSESRGWVNSFDDAVEANREHE